MSEKDDIMGLAFLVGGAIHDLKRNTLGDGKFITQGLPDPASLVKTVAAQDISKLVEEGKREATGGIPTPTSPAHPVAAANAVAGSSPVSDAALQSMSQNLREILIELKKITARLGL